MSRLSTTISNTEIGGRLAAVREKASLTQIEFAEKLGLSPRAYANYERGDREMPTALFRLICTAFRIDPLWLLLGPDDTPTHIGQRRLDMEFLVKVIQAIEEWLGKHRLVLRADKKARLIQLIYEHCVESGKVDPKHVNNMIGLAA